MMPGAPRFWGPANATVEHLEKSLETRIDGDKAICTLKNRKDTPAIELVRKDGAWLLKAPKGLPVSKTSGERLKAAMTSRAMGDAADKARALVGTKGMTAEKIMKEAQKAMMKGVDDEIRDAKMEAETIVIFRIPGAWEDEGYKILDKYGVEYCDRSVSMWEAAGRAVAKVQGGAEEVGG